MLVVDLEMCAPDHATPDAAAFERILEEEGMPAELPRQGRRLQPSEAERLIDPGPPLHESVADDGGEAVDLLRARALRAMRVLPLIDRRVIEWRYGFGGETLTCDEVARRLGLGKTQAWRIEQRALNTLRSELGVEPAAATGDTDLDSARAARPPVVLRAA